MRFILTVVGLLLAALSNLKISQPSGGTPVRSVTMPDASEASVVGVFDSQYEAIAAALADSEFPVSGAALDLSSHITAIITATTKTPTHLLVSVEDSSIRWWDDGKTPTATQGHLLEGAAGQANYYWVRLISLAAWKCIAVSGTAKVRVSYYRRS